MSTVRTTNVKNESSVVNNIALDTSGNVTVGNNLAVTGTTTQTGSAAVGGNVTVGGATFSPSTPASGSVAMTGTLAMGSSFLRNRIINGAMAIDQRNSGASLSSGGSIIYCVDRWWFGSNGASTTAQRVAGSGSTQYRLRITGAASVTSVLCGQRIESANSYDLAGSTVTLSFDMANSLLTSASWSLAYANSTDSFGTFASPTVTTIASGIINITSTVTRYSIQITLPAAATTGLQVQFGVSAQTSGTWTIGNVQLEAGSVETPFERRQYGQELALCQRYYYVGTNAAYGYPSPNSGGYAFNQRYDFKVTMRATPTVSTTYSSLSNVSSINPSSRTADFFLDQIVSTVTTNTTWAVSYTATAEL